MGTYYYMVAVKAREALPLGKKVETDFGYQGPSVWTVNGHFRLPKDLMSLLIERFQHYHGEGDTRIVCGDELFDSDDIVPWDEEIRIVGGDRDFDPPLTKYLPEVERPEYLEQIMADEVRRIC